MPKSSCKCLSFLLICCICHSSKSFPILKLKNLGWEKIGIRIRGIWNCGFLIIYEKKRRIPDCHPCLQLCLTNRICLYCPCLKINNATKLVNMRNKILNHCKHRKKVLSRRKIADILPLPTTTISKLILSRF